MYQSSLSLSGAERMYGVIKDMAGVRPNSFFKLCWLYLTPLVSLVREKTDFLFTSHPLTFKPKIQNKNTLLQLYANEAS